MLARYGGLLALSLLMDGDGRCLWRYVNGKQRDILMLMSKSSSGEAERASDVTMVAAICMKTNGNWKSTRSAIASCHRATELSPVNGALLRFVVSNRWGERARGHTVHR